MISPSEVRIGPWFSRHPCLAAVSAAGLFAAIAAVRFVAGDERDAALLLLVLPIALVALAFGLRAGAVAAVGSITVLVVWVLVADIDLSPLGWAARVTPLVLLGLLIGHASDTQRRAELTAARLAVIEERQREAVEINDTILQRLAVAKWNVESGNKEAGTDALTEVMEASENLVADLLTGLGSDRSDRRRSRSLRQRRRAGV